MSTDLATLGLRVDGSGATSTVEQFGNASERAGIQATGLEKAALRQTAAFQNIQATVRQAASGIQGFQSNAVDGAVAIEHMAAAHARAEPVVSEHTLSIGRLSRSLEGFVARAVGANEQLALITASFGHAEIGGLAVVGVLAGLFAGVEVWRAWTEETRKTKEENDKLTKSL